ncbi:EF-P 5-aminopentanol modification-associated protein YfmH [Alkaliphilus serpentinus]|uniref:Insulinase family protein n=1 Tax=Alkaliphilus serpentinus TaxID=1482731 RepID=A0A833HSC1_9FIRM|nr:pitrilysin family protein [Alkaliphilus serpentinus]KAB3533205.1 insulinase family protein [Alkaliphilus serpentinus]
MQYDKIIGEAVKEVLYRGKFQNGLEVFFLPKKGYIKKFALFATKFGSNDLVFNRLHDTKVIEVPEGIAHFLEHKMFESQEGNVFDKFAPLGASVNAYTNFNVTAYYFTATNNFYENLKLLISFVQNPYFTDENVEKEKGIITQEIKMYQDNPQWKVFFNLLKAMYHKHPVRIDIAGTEESINRITKEDLYQCYNTFYHPSNMVLFIAGDLEKDKLFNEIEMSFDDQGSKEISSIVRHYPAEATHVKNSLVEEKMIVSTPLFYLGYKEKEIPYDHTNFLKHEAIIRVLLDMVFGRSSDLYEDLYQKGLIDQSFNFDYVRELDYGHSIINGNSRDPHKVKETINNWILNRKKIGLKEEDFIRIKRKQIGENISFYNSIEYIGNSFVGYHFKGLNFMDYLQALKEVTYQDIHQSFINHFSEDLQVLSVINP